MNNTIQLRWNYYLDVHPKPVAWSKQSVYWDVNAVQARQEKYYRATDTYLYAALERFPIRNRDVLIIGSETPWYECICSQFGARVTTLEYRKIECSLPGIRVLTPSEFEKNPQQFDAIVSISSIEHAGLGRYGDPLDPNGDVDAMRFCSDVLRPDGLLYLAVPIGPDLIYWNSGRIYGKQRLSVLLNGWEKVDAFGRTNPDEVAFGYPGNQPVFVLRRPRAS